MSELATEYVKKLKQGKIPLPELDKKHPFYGVPLTPAEWRVLEPLAALHDEFVWCTYAHKWTIAAMANMSRSHCSLQLRRLVERGILRRYFVMIEGTRWVQQSCNEYEFVALGEHVVTQETRDVIFEYKRVRSAVQLSLRRGGRQRKALAGHAGSTPGEQSDAGSYEQACAVAGVELGGAGSADATLDDAAGDEGVFFVQESVDMIAGGNPSDCEGQSPRLPVELLESLKHDLSLPLPPFLATETVQKLPIIARAKATARARATATTSSLRAVRVSTESGVEAGMSSGARHGVQPEVERGLESYDEDLRAAVRWVLAQCGMAPESATRTMRRAVGDALRLRVDQAACTLGDAAELMVDSWREYVKMSWAIFGPVGLVKFARLGLWLDSAAWRWDRQAIRERRLRPF